MNCSFHKGWLILTLLIGLCALLVTINNCINQSRVDRLVSELKDPDPEVRETAARSLASLEQHARQSVPALIEALADEEKSVRDASAFALNVIGTPAVERLLLCLSDERTFIRSYAIRILGKPDQMPDGRR